MEFREAMEHYRAGTASPEEQALVEAELEKSRLIAEYELEQMEPLPEPEETSYEPLRRIRKSLRRRNSRLVLAAAALVVVLLLLANWGILPLFDAFYFDPEQSTICEGISDFDLLMKYQMELHHPGAGYFGSYTERTGIGRYTVSLHLFNPVNGYSFVDAELNKGELTFSGDYLRDGYVPTVNLFAWDGRCTRADGQDEQTESALEKVAALPDYVNVTAAVSFGEDLTMEELLELRDRHPEVTFWWAGVMCSSSVPTGVLLQSQGAGFGEAANKIYPALEIDWEDSIESEAALYEEHFRSTLRLMNAHPDLVELLNAGGYADYGYILDEVEAEGVQIYGVYVTASPSELLALMEEAATTDFRLLNAEISVH